MSFISSEDVYEATGEDSFVSIGSISVECPLEVASKYTEELYQEDVATTEGLKVSTIMQKIYLQNQAGVDLVQLKLLLDPENVDPWVRKETFRDLITKWLRSFVIGDNDNVEETRSDSAMSSRSAVRLPEFRDCDADFDLIETKQKMEYIMKENNQLKLELETSQMSCEKQDTVVSNLIEKLEAQKLFISQQMEEHDRVQRDLTFELQKEKTRCRHLEKEMQRNSIACKDRVDELMQKISSIKEQYQDKLEDHVIEIKTLKGLLEQQYINVSRLEKGEETLQHKLLNSDKLNQELSNKIHELEKSNTLLKYEKGELKEQIAISSNKLLEIKNQAMLSNFGSVNNKSDLNDVEERSFEHFIIPPTSSTPKRKQSLYMEMALAERLDLSNIAAENVLQNCDPFDEDEIQCSTQQQDTYHTAEFGNSATSTVNSKMPNEFTKPPQSIEMKKMLIQKKSDIHSVDISLTGRPQCALTLEKAKRTLFKNTKRSLHSKSLPTSNTCHTNKTVILQRRSLSQSNLTGVAVQSIYNSITQTDSSQDVYLSSNETDASHNTSSSGRGSVGTGVINCATFCVNPALNDASHGCEDIVPKAPCYHHNCSTIDNDIIINNMHTDNEIVTSVLSVQGDTLDMFHAKPAQTSAQSSEIVVSESSTGFKVTSDTEIKSSQLDTNTCHVSTQCDTVAETSDKVELVLCVQSTQTDVSENHMSIQSDVMPVISDHVKVDLVTQDTQTDICTCHISTQCDVVSDISDHVKVDLVSQDTQTDICSCHISTQCDVLSDISDNVKVDLVSQDTQTDIYTCHISTQCDVLSDISDNVKVDLVSQDTQTDICACHISTQCDVLSDISDNVKVDLVSQDMQTDIYTCHISTQCDVLSDISDHVKVDLVSQDTQTDICTCHISTQCDIAVLDVGDCFNVDLCTQSTQTNICVNHIFTQCDIDMSGVTDDANVDSCMQLVATNKCVPIVSQHCKSITTRRSMLNVGIQVSTESRSESTQMDERVYDQIHVSTQYEKVMLDASSQVLLDKCAISKDASTQYEKSISEIGTQVTLDVNSQFTQTGQGVNMPIFNMSSYYPITQRQTVSNVLCQRFIQLIVFILLFLLIIILILVLGVRHLDWDTIECILLELGATYEGPILV